MPRSPFSSHEAQKAMHALKTIKIDIKLVETMKKNKYVRGNRKKDRGR